MAFYFAFGSNMSTSRLQARIADAEPLGVARLTGWRFCCNKRGRDGSAKANIVRDESAVVWGVLFRFSDDELPRLDRIEGGYERTTVNVQHEGRDVACVTYVSTRENDDHVPFGWYKAHIVAGAEEHDLPAAYVADLRSLPQRSPDD